MEYLALIVALLFFLAGIAGTVLPLLPGTPLIFAGMLAYGLMTGFQNLDFYFFLIQGIAMVLTFFIDHIAAVIATKKYGGSNKASLGVIIGILLGAIILAPLGLILGAYIGAVIGEIISGKHPYQALKTGVRALIGFLGSAIVKLTVSLAMLAWFFIRIF